MFFFSFAALEVFNSRRKMGGEEFSLKYREKLEVEIMEAFDNFRILNENKNIFKAANTPITLATVAMICYIASQILGMIKLFIVCSNNKKSIFRPKKNIL